MPFRSLVSVCVFSYKHGLLSSQAFSDAAPLGVMDRRADFKAVCFVNNNTLLHQLTFTRTQARGNGIKYTPNSTKSVDENHTHFVFVDDGRDGLFGGEIEFRSALEVAMHKHFSAPIVVVVVEGLSIVRPCISVCRHRIYSHLLRRPWHHQHCSAGSPQADSCCGEWFSRLIVPLFLSTANHRSWTALVVLQTCSAMLGVSFMHHRMAYQSWIFLI